MTFAASRKAVAPSAAGTKSSQPHIRSKRILNGDNRTICRCSILLGGREPGLRIALVTDAWSPQINGVVTTLNHVKIELEALGHEFLVIHPGLFRTIKCPKYPEIRLSVLPGRRVRRMLDAFGPDAIHIATEGPLGMSARRLCRARSIAFTTSYHTQFPMYVKRYFGVPERWTYALTRWFHNAAQRTLAPTPSVRDQLQARRLRNIKVWTRGVDTELFKPYGKEFLPEKRPIFLYAGRVALEKNIEAFLS